LRQSRAIALCVQGASATKLMPLVVGVPSLGWLLHSSFRSISDEVGAAGCWVSLSAGGFACLSGGSVTRGCRWVLGFAFGRLFARPSRASATKWGRWLSDFAVGRLFARLSGAGATRWGATGATGCWVSLSAGCSLASQGQERRGGLRRSRPVALCGQEHQRRGELGGLLGCAAGSPLRRRLAGIR
jgi:hypothetical protein